MPARPRCFRIRRSDQLAALASPARQEVLDAVQSAGPCTVAELAAQLGRRPSALYYHVHALAAVGLLVERNRRRSGARAEVVYGLVADRIQVASHLESPAAARLLGRSSAAWLRRAQREFQAALQAEGALAKRRGHALFLARMNARLDAAALAEIAEHVTAIQAVFRRRRAAATGKPYAFTAALAPLAARAGKPKHVVRNPTHD